jgi:hypothetical protein
MKVSLARALLRLATARLGKRNRDWAMAIPARILLPIEEYQRLIGKGQTLWDIFSDKDDGGDFDFQPPKLNIGFCPAEFGED